MSGSRVNTQFGPYRLDELLGRGGMGEVYRAYDTVKDRVVAVKLLNPGLAGDATYQERFKRESHAAARLGEPHVIPIHDWGEIEGVLFIDMRLVDGEDLRALLRRERPLEAERAVAIVEQVASALDAAHADGLVHRDIKPENILIGQNDFAYLVDFGIAHGADDTHLTQAGSAIGSIAYMAPELFDAVPVSTSSDIYALACVLFECLTGRVPHPADTITSAIKAAAMSPPPAPSAVNTAVPSAMDSVIARGLDPDPARRYGTATELAAAARAALRGEADPAAGPAAPPTVTPGDPGWVDLVKVDGPEGKEPPTIIRGSPGSDAVRATQLRPVGDLGSSYPSNPQNYSAPQHYSGYQNYSGPQNYTGPQQYPGAPASAYPGQGYQPPPERDRSVAYVLIGVIAVAVLGLVAVGAYWLFSKDSAGDITASPTTTVTQAPPATEIATATFPPGAVPCDATSAIGSSVTTCPFAQAVRDSYNSQGEFGQARSVVATSPTNGQTYTMDCAPLGGDERVVQCTGGVNAVVVVLAG